MTPLHGTTVSFSLNGQTRPVRRGSTVADVVAMLATGGRGVAVARNGEVVPRGQWAATVLDDDDNIEVLTAAQGG